MKILYFASVYSPHDCKWINRISVEHEVVVLYPPAKLPNNYLNPEIISHPVLQWFPFNKKARKKVLARIHSIIDDFKPDLVHSMYIVPNALWANRIHHLPKVITTRGSDILVEYPSNYQGPLGKWSNLKKKILDREVKKSIRNASVITCTSAAQHKAISQITETESYIIRTGIDTNRIDEILNSIGPPEPVRPFTVFSPRFSKENYNIDVILAAFKELNRLVPASRLVLLNDEGAYFQKLIRELDSKFSDKVDVVPILTFEDLIKQYVNSDVVVMIPESDGTPNTGLEAMYCQRPLIVGTSTYDEDLFNPQTCVQLQEHSSKALFDQLHRIYLNESVIEPEMQKRVVMERANLSNSVDQLLSLYSKILSA